MDYYTASVQELPSAASQTEYTDMYACDVVYSGALHGVNVLQNKALQFNFIHNISLLCSRDTGI